MKFNKAFLYLLLLLGVTSCKKYIDVSNPDSLSDPEFWKNENNVRTYNWEFYNMFAGYGNGNSTNGDFYFTTFTDDQLPSTLSQYAQNTSATNGDWSFTFVRKANIMLERIDGIAAMNDEAKNHWKGIARFFRAFQYFKLVQTFGDVPWYGHSIEVEDSTQLYKPRDSRKLVMDSVLEDLNFAVANLRQADQPNTVNKDVALALKARICLFEGTYREYHKELKLPDAGKFLTEAKNAAQALIDRPYALNANYQSIYNANDLNNNKEVMLYKRYEATFLTHSTIAYLYSSTVISGLSRSAVESYLCTDGLPISLSPLYQQDADLDKTLANRDKRLKLSIDTTYLYYKGHIKNSLTSSTGYRVTKFLPDTNGIKAIPLGIGQNLTDAPLFYLSEVYLNYAEAAAELDKMGLDPIEQTDLDNSINKLRARAGVAKLSVNPGFTDPKMDADFPSSLIWEIRRERRVELMMDGFRYQDLMRWKKGTYMDSKENPNSFLGAKVPANGSITRNADGYIMPYSATSQRVFTDPKNYLSAIPTNQILLYPEHIQKTMQNPGW
jgi:starch-binding outer membrane protein, SusD/RagB family